MKIVSWNCRGKFREKFKKIIQYNADIYVIPESENPEKYMDNPEYSEFKKFCSNYKWIGNYDDKGLGIFAKDNIKLELNEWTSKQKFFISVKVNNSFDLVAVWTQEKYVEVAIDYLRIFEDKIKESDKIVFCGDFNSSPVFNDKHKGKNHDDMVKIFDSMGLKSIYHEIKNEEHGKESMPTFFQYLHEDEPYHLDYVFANPEDVTELTVGTYDEFVASDDNKSDHVPLIFKIK